MALVFGESTIARRSGARLITYDLLQAFIQSFRRSPNLLRTI